MNRKSLVQSNKYLYPVLSSHVSGLHGVAFLLLLILRFALRAWTVSFDSEIKLIASDAAAGDLFGVSGGGSGGVATVGAASNDDAGRGSLVSDNCTTTLNEDV